MAVEGNLRLSAVRAFIDRIHPDMRLIKVKLVDKEIVLSVITAHELTDRIREDVSDAAAEIISDFPDAVRIVENITVSTAPLAKDDILKEGLIYRRAE